MIWFMFILCLHLCCVNINISVVLMVCAMVVNASAIIQNDSEIGEGGKSALLQSQAAFGAADKGCAFKTVE